MEINLKEGVIPVWDPMTGSTVLASEAVLLKHKALVETLVGYEITHDLYVESILRHVAPNNWLKFHGYKMRRKVR